MRYRRIGDVKVSAIGLGCMPLSIPGRPDREQAIAVVHAALDAGITFFDTADACTSADPGHNETLLAEALGAHDVLIATKGGLSYRAGGPWDRHGSPEYLAAAARASAARLGVESIGLYQFHRPDPTVPYEESIGALRELLDDGIIRLVGISNATIEQIQIADRVLGGRLASVQNQFSPSYRASEAELDFCAEHEIAFLPWSPLGGISSASALTPGLAPFARVAEAHGVTPQQVTLAWMLAKSPVVVPIPGSSRPETARASAEAATLRLSPDEVAALDATD